MKHVLILDDDESFIKMMEVALDAHKYIVASARNGVDGLKKLETFTPDIILLDIMMPKMNGFDFLTAMNEKYGEGKVPVLITSNSSSLDKISEGVTLGIRGYIVKSDESFEGIEKAMEGVFKQPKP